MKTWLDFYDYYAAAVPGCTYKAAADALRRAAQEFCVRTRVWRAYLEPVVTVAMQSNYVLPLAEGQEFVTLLSAKLGEQKVPVLLDEHIGNGSTGVIMLNQRDLVLQPAPPAGQNLVLRVVLKPSSDAAGVDDMIFEHYAEAIAEGAKARLYMMDAQPFSDTEAALRSRSLFDQAINRTITDVARSHGSAPLRVKASFM